MAEKKKRTLKKRTLIVLFISIAAAVSPVVADDLDAGNEPQAAPDLELKDLGDEVHRLEDYRDQVVLVNFWASWCAPCLVEMPGMQRLQQRLGPRGFQILGVNAGESRSSVWQTRRKLGVRFPLLLDEARLAVQDWEVKVFPSSFLIDGEGRIRHRITGMLDWNGPEAVRLVENLLNELPKLELTEKEKGMTAGRRAAVIPGLPDQGARVNPALVVTPSQL